MKATNSYVISTNMSKEALKNIFMTKRVEILTNETAQGFKYIAFVTNQIKSHLDKMYISVSNSVIWSAAVGALKAYFDDIAHGKESDLDYYTVQEVGKILYLTDLEEAA